MKKLIVAVVILLVVGLPVTWWLLRYGSPGQVRAIAAPMQETPDSIVRITSQTHASVGWSTANNEADAVRQALAMAEHRLGGKKAGFAMVAHTTGYNTQAVLQEVNRLLPPDVKVYGMTSGIAVVTQEGFHAGPVGSLAILLVSEDSGIRFGVGAADRKSAGSLQAMGEVAMKNAIADAGMSPDQRPNIVLYAGVTRRGGEMRILDGIANVTSPDTPVVGGNAGFDSARVPGVPFTREKTYSDGVVLVALYTNRTIGWAFEYGFRETDTTGTITKANKAGNLIYEIDGKPALDVYNGWLNGKLLSLLENESYETITGFTACNPISRAEKGSKGQMGYIVAEMIPTRLNLKDRSLPVYSFMPEGSTIRLQAGRWQNLLNRAEQVTTMALTRGGGQAHNIEFGVLNFCWAASQAIPSSELPKIPLLVRNKIPHTPFIGLFTKGEAGPLPGIRNVYCNLAVSMVLVEQEKEKKSSKESPSPK